MPLNPAVSLSEQIANHLSVRIIRGEIGPGERLPETELARELEVSTNSLREAFRLLESRHLVEIQPRKGARVCDISPDHVTDLYDFLFLLLSRLAARAAERWQEGDLNDIVELVAAMEERAREQDVAGAHEVAFTILRRSLRFTTNRYLMDAIEDLMPLLQRYSFIALREETSELDLSLRYFRELVANIQARDASAAASSVRAYGDDQCRIVLRAIEKQSAA